MATRACGTACSSAATAPAYSFGSRSTTSGRHSSMAARSFGSAAVVLSRPKISPITTMFASSGGSSGTRAQIAPSSSSGGASNCQKRKPAASTEPSRAGGPANITSWPARSNARANGTSGLKCPVPWVEVNSARIARESDARGARRLDRVMRG